MGYTALRGEKGRGKMKDSGPATWPVDDRNFRGSLALEPLGSGPAVLPRGCWSTTSHLC